MVFIINESFLHIYLNSAIEAQLFQLSLNTGCVPRAWKETTIIPIPKKTYVKEMKKFRPVTLTSILCKCLEKVVAGELTSKVAEYLDPLQCAYKPKRGVEDASLTLLNTATRHFF